MELVDKIIEIAGADVETLILNGGQGEIENQYLSARKAREELGWSPVYTVEEGLAETVPWYRELGRLRAPTVPL